jgi:UDP-glucose 4-epimerase
MKVFVTGGAGCIGSQLCLHMLNQGHDVVAYDNLLLGKEEFLKPSLKHPRFQFIKDDLLTDKTLSRRLDGMDLVFHLAANSDISLGRQRTDLDLQYGVIATYNTLEAMRVAGVRDIIFSSTSAIYGDAKIKPTPEDFGPLEPISLYGASKIAAESLCSAFAHNYGMKTWIYRFANLVGPNLTHGVIFDFVHKLKANPRELSVLGNGTQKKSYLNVDDCIEGMLFGFKNAKSQVNIFNLASQGVTPVKVIAEHVVKKMSPQAKVQFGSEDRGWVGDVPYTWLSPNKLEALGWTANKTSDEAVFSAIDSAIQQYA